MVVGVCAEACLHTRTHTHARSFRKTKGIQMSERALSRFRLKYTLCRDTDSEVELDVSCSLSFRYAGIWLHENCTLMLFNRTVSEQILDIV